MSNPAAIGSQDTAYINAAYQFAHAGNSRTQVETELPDVQMALAKLQALATPPGPHSFG